LSTSRRLKSSTTTTVLFDSSFLVVDKLQVRAAGRHTWRQLTLTDLADLRPVLPNACKTFQLGEVSAKTIICWQTECYLGPPNSVALGLPTNYCLSADFAELRCLTGIRQDGVADDEDGGSDMCCAHGSEKHSDSPSIGWSSSMFSLSKAYGHRRWPTDTWEVLVFLRALTDLCTQITSLHQPCVRS